MSYGQEYGALLERIAGEADAIALRYFGSNRLGTKRKSDGSVVTVADKAIEEMAREKVARSGVKLDVYGEELGGEEKARGPRLIIDPIDGTEEFSRGIATFGTLLAIEREGGIVAGLVSAPALGARWWAYQGEGAWRDGRRIHVSEVERLGEAMVITCGTICGKNPDRVKKMRRVADAARQSRGLGGFWQHALVAEGAAEAGIDTEMKPWDIAPLLVIVEEAGGSATNFAGERTIYGGSLLTTNGRVHEEVVAILREGRNAAGEASL